MFSRKVFRPGTTSLVGDNKTAFPFRLKIQALKLRETARSGCIWRKLTTHDTVFPTSILLSIVLQQIDQLIF